MHPQATPRPPLSQLVHTEIARITKFLETQGLGYTIELPDGSKLSNMKTKTGHNTPRRKICNWDKYQVKERLRAMQIGEVIRFRLEPQDSYTLQGLQKVIAGAAVYTLGAGCLLTTMHPKTSEVECLCVDRKIQGDQA